MKLRFDQVTLSYPFGRPVLTDLTFDLTPGLWVLTGPNGSGKSTLLRCAAGVLAPWRGHLRCGTKDAYQLDHRYRSLVGYAPQEIGAHSAKSGPGCLRRHRRWYARTRQGAGITR